MMQKIKNGLKKLGRKIKSLFTKKRMLNSARTLVSGGLTWYVMWYLLPTWLAVLIVGVEVVHEVAHYIYGRRHGLPAHLPRFIPGIYFVLGWVYVDQDPEDHGNAPYYLVGPAVGIVFCLLWMAACYYLGFMPGVYAGAWQLLGQIYSAILGSDGRMYQRVRKHVQREEEVLDYSFPTVATA